MAFRYFVCILFSLYFLPVFCWGRVVKIGNNTDVQEQFIEDSVVYIVSSNIDLKGKTLSIPENSENSWMSEYVVILYRAHILVVFHNRPERP